MSKSGELRIGERAGCEGCIVGAIRIIARPLEVIPSASENASLSSGDSGARVRLGSLSNQLVEVRNSKIPYAVCFSVPLNQWLVFTNRTIRISFSVPIQHSLNHSVELIACVVG